MTARDAERFIFEAVEDGFPMLILWRGANSPQEMERLRIASRERLRGGPNNEVFVSPSQAWQPLATMRRRGIGFVHARAILARALGEPFDACCKVAEEALPEQFRDAAQAGAEVAASPPAVERVEIGEPSEAETPDAPPAAEDDDRQRRIDAWMLDYLMGFAARGEKPPKRQVAIADCGSVTGATWRAAYDARMRAPEYLRGKGGRPKKTTTTTD